MDLSSEGETKVVARTNKPYISTRQKGPEKQHRLDQDRTGTKTIGRKRPGFTIANSLSQPIQLVELNCL